MENFLCSLIVYKYYRLKKNVVLFKNNDCGKKVMFERVNRLNFYFFYKFKRVKFTTH